MFTLFWLTGEYEILKGNTLSEAMNNSGYGGGSIRALDFYANGDERDNWKWNKEKHTWEKNNE